MELFSDYTLRTVALGSAILGIVSGALGSFAVLRRQSLLGDAISHAALPGIALAFLLTGSKSPVVLLAGAALAGWVATLLVMAVTETSRVKYDAALGTMLSVFFGFGLVLLTFIQKRADASQAGLDTFLFGQAAALVQRDVVTMGVLGGAVLLCLTLGWKEFKLLSFDPDYGETAGLPVRRLDIGLTTLLVLAITIGLQTVGVVLMSAMIIAPAAGARQWTDRLGIMVVLSAGFGAVSGVAGAVISSRVLNLPTGPMIVVCASILALVSLFAAPNRGLFWRWFRSWQNGKRLRSDAVLLDLYALAKQHEDPQHPHKEAVLDAMMGQAAHSRPALETLTRRGLVRRAGEAWALTPEGLRRSETLRGSWPHQEPP